MYNCSGNSNSDFNSNGNGCWNNWNDNGNNGGVGGVQENRDWCFRRCVCNCWRRCCT